MSATRRSSSSPTGRHSAWSSSATDTAPPVQPKGRAAASERTGRLSEGTLVEASVVGRVLGVRILRLDAVVVLSPTATPRWPAAPALPASRASAWAPSGRLAGALRSIEEGRELLAEARRRHPGP